MTRLTLCPHQCLHFMCSAHSHCSCVKVEEEKKSQSKNHVTAMYVNNGWPFIPAIMQLLQRAVLKYLLRHARNGRLKKPVARLMKEILFNSNQCSCLHRPLKVRLCNFCQTAATVAIINNKGII